MNPFVVVGLIIFGIVVFTIALSTAIVDRPDNKWGRTLLAVAAVAGISVVMVGIVNAFVQDDAPAAVTHSRELPWDSTWYTIRSPATGDCYEIVQIGRRVDSVNPVAGEHCAPVLTATNEKE